ncbi:MAG: asparaginase domain-containing protein [Candidatus Gracilibacteria bacterium]|nr:asparaginase domain-containing protein [Candidatus Gracilibacteria bacterium]
MKKITFITCGGTIDKDYSVDKGSYYFTFGEPAIYRILRLVNLGFQTEIIDLLQKDSLDMDEYDRVSVKDTVQGVANDRIIITHGTDTMIDTGKLLDKYFKDKIIVLVGSSIPENFKNTDAHINIGLAIGICNTLADRKEYGVYICMNGQVFNIHNVQKNNDGTFSEIK